MGGQNDTDISKLSRLAIGAAVFVLAAAAIDAAMSPAKEKPTPAPAGSIKMAGSDERIKPIGHVESEEKAPAPVAAVEPRSGQEVYQQACMACHDSGVSGAPKLEAGAWDGRIAQGLSGLVSSAIAGKGAMPARGGNPTISDEEIQNAVQFMLSESGYADLVSSSDGSTSTGTTEVSIDGGNIYKTVCFSCHDFGVSNAPKPSDKAAWDERLANGSLDDIYANAINGKGAMPAKGGRPNLTDDEVKAAVDFMMQ